MTLIGKFVRLYREDGKTELQRIRCVYPSGFSVEDGAFYLWQDQDEKWSWTRIAGIQTNNKPRISKEFVRVPV